MATIFSNMITISICSNTKDHLHFKLQDNIYVDYPEVVLSSSLCHHLVLFNHPYLTPPLNRIFCPAGFQRLFVSCTVTCTLKYWIIFILFLWVVYLASSVLYFIADSLFICTLNSSTHFLRQHTF